MHRVEVLVFVPFIWDQISFSFQYISYLRILTYFQVFFFEKVSVSVNIFFRASLLQPEEGPSSIADAVGVFSLNLL